jgi:hypothetical protein
MSRHAKKTQGNAAAEHLSAGVLALCFPMPAIKSLLADCRALAQRTRDLPPEVMVFFIIAMSLFPDVGYQSVLRWLLNGLHWLGNPSFTLCVKSSLADARKRLGGAPLRRIYEHFALPLAHLGLRGSYWKKFHLVALDGSTLALQDTPENALTYGRPSNQNGDGAWPLARYVALAEVGTHLIFKAVFGRSHDSEITLSRKIIARLKPGMWCLADRLFPGFELWQEAAATGCALVWRAKVGLALTHLKTLPDGSWLAHWQPSKQERKKGRKLQPQTVRVVEYQLRDPAAAEGQQEPGNVYRLITTILDPAVADAQELAALYPQRWEIELSIKESKTVLRKGRSTLRSKLPDLVEQEFWGMLLAHYAVRKMMAEAALDHHLDPDDWSDQGGVEIIKSKLAGPALPFPPPANQGGSEKDFS